MGLHCKHQFHLKCIFGYWDHPNRYLFSCPVCFKSPMMNHAAFGMSPGNSDPAFDTNNHSFVHNLFNYGPPHQAPPFYFAPGNTATMAPEQLERMRNVYYEDYDIPVRVQGAVGTVTRNRYWELENRLAAEYMSGAIMGPDNVGSAVAYHRFHRRARNRGRRDMIAGQGRGLAGL